MFHHTTTKGTGPLGTDSSTKSKSFYTAIRDFDYALRAILAASPRQILAQGKDVLRKFDAIIDACAAYEGDKAEYFQRMKIRAQNAKTRAIGPMLRAVENASQFGLSRPRLMSVLGTFDIQGVGREPAENDVRWLSVDQANHAVATYRLDQLLNAGLAEITTFAVTAPEGAGTGVAGIVQRPAPGLNDSFDVLLSMDNSSISQTARQLRRDNQRQLLDVILKGNQDIERLPNYADAAFGFSILALDGEMLTLAMDDLLAPHALGVLSQQLIEVHAHLLHLELDGNMYNPAQWKASAQTLF
ncbi:MAG: hypothetical protein IPK52_18930 [Chloroflexi bacterium]|nr:hypothetical protein [Chloroflexota bacterium]